MKKSIIFIGFCLFAAQLSFGQDEKVYKWGVEAELVQPFIPTVEIFNLQVTRNLFSSTTQRGELVLGVGCSV